MKPFLRNLTVKAAILFVAVFMCSAAHTQTNVTGGIFSNTTWTKANSPYIVTDTVKVFNAVTLTIQPGVVVKFKKDGYLWNVGTLIANGTATDSIIFTSDSSAPYPGVWNCIYNGTSFQYCRVSYSQLGINQASADVRHCVLSNNGYGIWTLSYDVDTCVFIGNSTGLRLGDSVYYCQFLNNGIGDNASSYLYSCTFKGNTNYGSYFMQGRIVSCDFDSNATGIFDPHDSVIYCTIQHNTTGIDEFGGHVTKNNITYNHVGVNAIGSNHLLVLNNITNNYIGVQSDGDAFSCNSIYNNTAYNLVLTGSLNVDARGNYWNQPDSAHVQPTIYDAHQNVGLGLAIFTPIDTVPCPGTCSNNYVQNICIVSTDTSINKNIIVWDRSTSPPNSAYNVYDSTSSGWVKIGSVGSTALSQYTDLASNPTSKAYSYRITTIDSCGESPMSSTATSIYLQVDILTGKDSLYWTPYIGFATPIYYIYKGPALNALTLIDSVSGSTLDYVDTMPTAGYIYLVKAVNPSGPCVPTTRVTSSYTTASFSNGGVPKKPAGLKNIEAYKNSIVLSPNPNNGAFKLQIAHELVNNSRIEVYNAIGEKVYDTKLYSATNAIDLSSQQSGIYLYRVLSTTGELATQGKFIIK